MSLLKSYQGLLFGLLLMIPQLCGGQPLQAEQLKKRVDSLAAKNLFSGSVLVGDDSSVVFYHSAGFSSRDPKQPITKSTTFEIASLTKQFTAALILKLYEQGRISLHAPFGKYLHWFTGSYKESVSIHQLLTHQSGIPNYTDLPDWPSLSTKRFEKREFVKQLLAGKPLQFTPGSDFSYSNSNYYLLGLIAEEVTQKSYSALLEECIFKPLGMTHSGTLAKKVNPRNNLATGYERLPNGYIEKAPKQHYATAFSVSGIYSTPDDLFTWSRAFTNRSFFPDSIQQLMMTPHVNNYGYGLLISDADPGEVAEMIRNPFLETFENENKQLQVVWHWGPIQVIIRFS